MNIRIYILTAFLIFAGGMAQQLFAQSQSLQKENPQTDSSFFDHFAWTNSSKVDIHEINIIGGYSFHSTRGFWGKIPRADLQLYALRYNRKLLTYNKRHLIEYVAELNLAANYTIDPSRSYRSGTYTGLGISPIGFQINWGRSNSVQPFFKSSGGFMYFRQPFPDNRGVKFNFTLELGAGVEFILAEDLSFSIGYKYHHMSNGQFGQINPGVDSNVFYTGFTIF
ncbi:MAG: acyloxyacyl hydrolase [Fodinibius sp.]|nr:acyloxyacyl hydrolase [Fodinibius sp.]